MTQTTRRIQWSAATLAAFALLSACGGGGDATPPPAPAPAPAPGPAPAPAAVSGNTATCATPCIDFTSASLGYSAFGNMVLAAQSADPADASNKVAKFIKGPTSAAWAGVTLYTSDAVAATVGSIDMSSSKIITVRVYASAVGQTMKLKIEDAANAGVSVEVDRLTTTAYAWETLSFDFSTPTVGTYNPAATYNRLSLFPQFSGTNPPATDTTTFFDEVKFTLKAAAPAPAPTPAPAPAGAAVIVARNDSKAPVSPGSGAAYDISVAGSPKALPGNYVVGRYTPNAGEQTFFVGDFAEQIISVYGFSATDVNQWGFGIYIANGGTGWNIASASNYHFYAHPTGECAGKCATTVILVSTANANCKAIARVPLGVDYPYTAYTVNLASGFAVSGCTTNTMAAFKAIPVAEVHFQMLRADMQFTTGVDTATNTYPNGMGVGGNIFFD